MTKKILALLLTVAMLVVVATGCDSNSGTTSNPSSVPGGAGDSTDVDNNGGSTNDNTNSEP